MLKRTLYKAPFYENVLSVFLSEVNVQSQKQCLFGTAFDFMKRKAYYFVPGDTDRLIHSYPCFSGTRIKAC